MLANDIRQAYVDFFRERGHLHLPSAPLIPIDALGNEDKSTLFSGSGMQQFKPYFTGAAQPPNSRVTTVQKCVRTGDIDAVGDYSHCTFFEMMGNFSFGDYFKAEVIPWTWEFLTNVLKLDGDRFCATVFHEDDEAFQVWHDIVGLPEDRIHRMGEDKNFWPANAIKDGPNGPCGPCSEVFYRVAPLDQMTTTAGLSSTERYKIDDDAGRWLEVWNNVFTQFDRGEDAHGKCILTPLPKKNNDTGAGFDRNVMVAQGKSSVFETDLFQPILDEYQSLSGKKYGGTMEPTDFALRVLAEHTRTAVFCVGDGILPSNEGAGYVLRYIMRRALRYGKTALGLNEPFMHRVAPLVIQEMGGFYTELREREQLILKTIQGEEERFLRTLDQGLQRLDEIADTEEVKQSKVFPGIVAFTLHDTHGFPLSLTKDILAERGIDVDDKAYGEAMEAQRVRSREASNISKDVFGDAGGTGITVDQPTEFLAYRALDSESNVLAILLGGAQVESARAGDKVEIVLDRTPFYAESGGQIGDTGLLTTSAGDTTCAFKAKVVDTHRRAGIIYHSAQVEEGELHSGEAVTAQVDSQRRRSIVRNHTTTHLLQAALRTVLGEHVHQKGSLVAPDRLRFDFTHTSPLSHEELEKIEAIVNGQIQEDLGVTIHEDVPIEEAKKLGAMMLFGEKYGDKVRVVEIPGISMEFCGGTHLQRTSQAGLFKIVSENGVAAGVRRIEAVTGAGAYEYLLKVEAERDQLSHRLTEQRSDYEKQLRDLRRKGGSSVELAEHAVGGAKVFTGSVPDADAETLGGLADRTIQTHRTGVAVVAASAVDGKVLFVIKGTKDLVERGFHAGNLVREVAKIAGGGGGGRPDFAQAGGKDASKIDEALAEAVELVAGQLG